LSQSNAHSAWAAETTEATNKGISIASQQHVAQSMVSQSSMR